MGVNGGAVAFNFYNSTLMSSRRIARNTMTDSTWQVTVNVKEGEEGG